MKDVDYRVITLFKIVGEPVRFEILKLLNENEMPVSQIAESTDEKIANISQHLRLLRTSGLVGCRTMENYVIYYLKKKRLIKLIDFARSILSRRKKAT